MSDIERDYELMRQHCLRLGNYHPESKESCHQAVERFSRQLDSDLGYRALGLLDNAMGALRTEKMATEFAANKLGTELKYHAESRARIAALEAAVRPFADAWMIFEKHPERVPFSEIPAARFERAAKALHDNHREGG